MAPQSTIRDCFAIDSSPFDTLLRGGTIPAALRGYQVRPPFLSGLSVMDALDILGGLLRQKSGSSGLGGAILKSIVTGGHSSAPAQQESRPIPQMPAGRPRIVDAPSDSQPSPLDGLEDMLRQAHSRQPSAAQRPIPQPSPVQRPSAPQIQAQRPSEQQPVSRTHAPNPGSIQPQYLPESELESGRDPKCELILQAMINAAKADGQIDQQEQEKIVEQIVQHAGRLTQDDIEYLRVEFSKPLNLRDFAWSVPLGAEQEIYAVSAMSVNLDSHAEATYLRDLAHGLRIPPQLCAQIHQRFGIPVLN